MTTFKAPPGESSPRTKPINENPDRTLGPNTKGRWMLAKNSVLLQSELFAGLDQATAEQFTATAELRTFAADEKIITEGQQASFVYCVMDPISSRRIVPSTDNVRSPSAMTFIVETICLIGLTNQERIVMKPKHAATTDSCRRAVPRNRCKEPGETVGVNQARE